MQRDSVHSVWIGAGIESGVEAAVVVQPRNVIATLSAGHEKIAADDNLSVGLDRDCIYAAVQAGRWIEDRLERAVAIQSRAVGAAHCVDGGEEAAQQNLSVRLQGETTNLSVGSGDTRRESGVETAITIESGDLVAAGPIDGGEKTADDDLPVRLERERTNTAAGGACSGIETCVETTVAVQARHTGAAHSVDGGEESADQNLPIRLYCKGLGGVVRSDCKSAYPDCRRCSAVQSDCVPRH